MKKIGLTVEKNKDSSLWLSYYGLDGKGNLCLCRSQETNEKGALAAIQQLLSRLKGEA